jgi:hypothetical protein
LTRKRGIDDAVICTAPDKLIGIVPIYGAPIDVIACCDDIHGDWHRALQLSNRRHTDGGPYR